MPALPEAWPSIDFHPALRAPDRCEPDFRIARDHGGRGRRTRHRARRTLRDRRRCAPLRPAPAGAVEAGWERMSEGTLDHFARATLCPVGVGADPAHQAVDDSAGPPRAPPCRRPCRPASEQSSLSVAAPCVRLPDRPRHDHGDPRSKLPAVRDSHPHPSQQPLLPLTMFVSVMVGLISLRADGKYSTLGAAFAFGWFLVSFALYGYAWILRDNGEWLASQREKSP